MNKFRIEKDAFERLIRAISLDGIIEQPTIEISEVGVNGKNTDPAYITFSYVRTKKAYFVEYNVENSLSFAFEAKKIMKIVRSLRGEVITFEKLDEEAIFYLSDETNRAEIPILESNPMKLPPILEEKEGEIILSDDLSFQLSESLEISQIDTSTIDTSTVIFSSKGGVLTLVQKEVLGYGFETVIAKNVVSTDFNVMFDRDYFAHLLNAVPTKESMDMKLGKEMPVLIQTTEEDMRTFYMLAPRVEGE